ncbi:MAG: DUF2141 domain-containing protein [Cyclobacteriaceae bacterium]
MKRLFILILATAGLIPGVMTQHDLQIVISQIEKPEGEVGIWLYRNEESYMVRTKSQDHLWVPVKQKTVTATFPNLPQGEYAIVIIQDLNGNKNLDTNFIGLPKEPYGFSNNPSTTFGPPSFQGAKFSITENMKIEIRFK